MINELRNEYLEKLNREEEEKIFNAIHEQAYWKRVEEENNQIFRRIKPTKKKSKIKEALQREMEIALLLILSAPTVLMLFILGIK